MPECVARRERGYQHGRREHQVHVQPTQGAGSLALVGADQALDPPPVQQPCWQAHERGSRVERDGVAHVPIGACHGRLQTDVDEHLRQVGQGNRQHRQAGEGQQVEVRSTDGGHTSRLSGFRTEQEEVIGWHRDPPAGGLADQAHRGAAGVTGAAKDAARAGIGLDQGDAGGIAVDPVIVDAQIRVVGLGVTRASEKAVAVGALLGR